MQLLTASACADNGCERLLFSFLPLGVTIYSNTYLLVVDLIYNLYHQNRIRIPFTYNIYFIFNKFIKMTSFGCLISK
jgi:hypothetical protein